MHMHLKMKADIWSNYQAYVACCRMASLDKLCLSASTIFNYQPRFNYHPPPQNNFLSKSFHCCHHHPFPKLYKRESHIYQNLSFGPGENRGVYLIQILIAGGWWLIYFCFAHHQLFSQSQDQISELLDFCKCFVIELKRLHCSSFESNPLKSCNTTPAQYTCKFYIYQDNLNCLQQKWFFFKFYPVVLKRQSE